jgi:hypothetical protein
MSPREDRQARNEVLFRDVNERIADLADKGLSLDFHVICECAQIGCGTMLRIELDDYRRVRAHPRRFLIAPGHAVPEIEDVVVQQDDFQVVEKHADVAI